MLQRDDLRGALRRYGGKARRKGSTQCPVFGPPAPPPSFKVADEPGRTTLTYRAPAGLRRTIRLDTGPRLPPLQITVSRGLGQCPTSPLSPTARGPAGKPGTTQVVPLESEKPPPGQYCYVGWTKDPFGRFSAPSAPSVVSITADVDAGESSGATASSRTERWDRMGG